MIFFTLFDIFRYFDIPITFLPGTAGSFFLGVISAGKLHG